MTSSYKIGRQALARLRAKSSVTPSGLVIGGAVQCFPWERRAQARFANLAARDAGHVVNIGYGLGYAHEVFDRTPRLRVDLIEINPSVMARAQRRSCPIKTGFHLSPWQRALPAVSTPAATIFFDAFPVEQSFDYSPASFIRYLNPFLELAHSLPWRACYFIAFDHQEIRFPAPRDMRVNRIARTKLPQAFQRPGLTTISLYQLRHVMLNDYEGRVGCAI